MKTIKEMTDAVIDIVHKNTDSDPEPWEEDDGRSGVDLNLSPAPECYDKLNAYFSTVIKEIAVYAADIIEGFYNQ